MHLSDAGVFAEQFWFTIPEHFPFVKLDAFVVMPNHVHGIVIIQKPLDFDENFRSDKEEKIIRTVEHDFRTPGQKRFRNPGKNNISSIIGSYKSVVTRHTRPTQPDFAWQPRFHDHIIRDRESFLRIRQYIIDNVKKWKADRFYGRGRRA